MRRDDNQARSMTMARTIPLCAAALLTAALPLIAGCAPAGSAEAGASALTPKQAKTLDKQLAGKVAGKPMNCLPNDRTTDTIRVSDYILLYRAGGNLKIGRASCRERVWQ